MAEDTPDETQTQTAEASEVEVQEPQLPEAEANVAPMAGGQIDVLLDTPLLIEVRLGKVEAKARDLLRLGSGSVLQLDKQVGEPLELYLRGKPFATGQLVVVGERLAVRITEIVQPAEDGESGVAESV